TGAQPPARDRVDPDIVATRVQPARRSSPKLLVPVGLALVVLTGSVGAGIALRGAVTPAPANLAPQQTPTVAPRTTTSQPPPTAAVPVRTKAIAPKTSVTVQKAEPTADKKPKKPKKTKQPKP
ncbi:hypothetical protein, partial [Kribbella albertanoniae]|uniref:hypothetical protein n=1 Tax=Kribbella albertanoniae TaxID=1266829 RepID=UPI00192D7B51